MSNNTLDKIGMIGLAGVGGITGYLWAGMLTATEILAVSNPVGIVCGALVFLSFAMDADTAVDE